MTQAVAVVLDTSQEWQGKSPVKVTLTDYQGQLG